MQATATRPSSGRAPQIHANADLISTGWTDFSSQAVQVGIRAMLRGGTPVVADVEMICSACRCCALAHLAWSRTSSFSDADVIAQAQAENTTRAVQVMQAPTAWAWL